ncbi:hypothetical protein ACF1BE_04315 [Streptomyces sp. NPDC014991]|uniref:hypothetical protein n=1 Tax=Streptomyces sp. NPDC014991 TaxID=3364935 RepID=UPI0036FF0027
MNSVIREIGGERHSPSDLPTTAMPGGGCSPPPGVRGATRWAVAEHGTLSDVAEETGNAGQEEADGGLW